MAQAKIIGIFAPYVPPVVRQSDLKELWELRIASLRAGQIAVLASHTIRHKVRNCGAVIEPGPYEWDDRIGCATDPGVEASTQLELPFPKKRHFA